MKKTLLSISRCNILREIPITPYDIHVAIADNYSHAYAYITSPNDPFTHFVYFIDYIYEEHEQIHDALPPTVFFGIRNSKKILLLSYERKASDQFTTASRRWIFYNLDTEYYVDYYIVNNEKRKDLFPIFVKAHKYERTHFELTLDAVKLKAVYLIPIQQLSYQTTFSLSYKTIFTKVINTLRHSTHTAIGYKAAINNNKIIAATTQELHSATVIDKEILNLTGSVNKYEDSLQFNATLENNALIKDGIILYARTESSTRGAQQTIKFICDLIRLHKIKESVILFTAGTVSYGQYTRTKIFHNDLERLYAYISREYDSNISIKSVVGIDTVNKRLESVIIN